MKKLLLSLAVILSTSAFASDDSVYAWGPWAEGIKPAAGPVYVAPAPVAEPDVDTRETMALLREYTGTTPPTPSVTGIGNVNPSIPVETTPPPVVVPFPL